MQTGRINPEPYKRKHPDWIVFDYDPDFGRWLAGAKVVITHFGKTAIDAVLSYRKPTIIVLNPEWKYTVGEKDAEILARKLNALLIRSITFNNLEKAIHSAIKITLPNYENGAENLTKFIISI